MNNQTITNRTSKISLIEGGIVWVEILPEVKQSLKDAKDNLLAAIEIRGGVRRPILIDLRHAEPLEPPIRHFYSGKKLGASFTKLGILIPSSEFGRIMGNIYLAVARPGVPIKLLLTEEEAFSWLKT